MSGFFLVTEDIIEIILARLPAVTFAYAACVNKCWYNVCNRILKRPKLASALSLNPSLDDAVKEVFDKVLSEPIRPHFAIACVSKAFNLEVAHRLIIGKLGSTIPIITNVSSGIIGVDAITDEIKEVKWDESTDDHSNPHSNTLERGLVLLVGNMPGLEVGLIPLVRPIQEPTALVDKFLMDILHYTSSVSDSTTPAGIILFGDSATDMRPIVSKLDSYLPEETVIVGGSSSSYMCRSGDDSLNSLVHSCFFDAVALVFAKDRNMAKDVGEIRFQVILSTGLMPFGPKLEIFSILTNGSKYSWVTARLQGQNHILNGQQLLHAIKEQFREGGESSDVYLGITRTKIQSNGSGLYRRGTSLDFYEVKGAYADYFCLDGVGINPEDSFLFYQSDADTASASCDHAYNNLSVLRAGPDHGNSQQVLGGLIFSCYRRGESFFGHPNVDSFPFCKNFPEAPVAGVFCKGEIGRGFTRSLSERLDEENFPRCCSHVYSTIYLALYFIPAPLEN